jgi:hypothetical protein
VTSRTATTPGATLQSESITCCQSACGNTAMEAAAPPGFMVKRGVRGSKLGGGSELERSGSAGSSKQLPGTPTTSAAAAGGSSGPGLVPDAPGDTPFGFGAVGAVGPLSGSLAAFKRRCEWFYLDPAGEEHGPVALPKILNWYKKGHFHGEVKVCACL